MQNWKSHKPYDSVCLSVTGDWRGEIGVYEYRTANLGEGRFGVEINSQVVRKFQTADEAYACQRELLRQPE